MKGNEEDELFLDIFVWFWHFVDHQRKNR